MLAHLRQIAARGPDLSDRVFAKVGDSMTDSGDFLYCFGKRRHGLELGEHNELAPVIQHFRAGSAAGESPFERQSKSAKIGWSAWQVLSGAPGPLVREVEAVKPRFALVQFGTNDIEIGALHHFADQMFGIVELLERRGVIPILFTIPPRKDKAEAALWVPRYNAVIRGVAQAHQIPLVDYFERIRKLPGSGLDADGIHPTTHKGKLGRDACDLTSFGLRHGYDLRNLLALEALERTRSALAADRAPEPEPARPSGSGSQQDPLKVTALPFIWFWPAATATEVAAKRCEDQRAPRGGELVLELERPAKLLAMGFDRGGVVVDLLAVTGPGGCVGRAERILTERVDKGSRLVLSVVTPGAGGSLLVLLDE